MAQQSLEDLLRQLLEKLETQAGPDRIIRDSEMFELFPANFPKIALVLLSTPVPSRTDQNPRA